MIMEEKRKQITKKHAGSLFFLELWDVKSFLDLYVLWMVLHAFAGLLNFDFDKIFYSAFFKK